MDLDAAPCNFNVNVEDWLNLHEKKVIVGKDCNGLNAGIVALPCIEKSLLFLDRMYELGKNNSFKWDQDIMIHLFNNEFKDFYIEPDKDFGFNNYVNWKCKGINEFVFGKHWGLHVPDPIGMRTPRAPIFKEMLEKITNNKINYRTPIIGGRFGNILYGLLNNYIESCKNNEKYIYVNSLRYSENIIEENIVNIFNLGDIYNANINESITDNKIKFIKEDPSSKCFAGFNIDFTEDQLNAFIKNIFLKSKAFENIKLIEDRLSINIRGGDYLNEQNLNNYKFNFEKYLNIALEYFKNKKIDKLDVYSDDFNYAKKFDDIFKKFNFNVTYNENTGMISDFVALSSYRHKILWNSTFSYWTGYISNVLFNGENYQDIFVPEYHVSWVNGGKAWQLNPKWNIVKDLK